MIARIRKSMDERDKGFTLVELLVVMIIIGILAAIAIPVFMNQQKKARDTAAKADVSTIGKEITSYFVDGTGTLALTGTAATATAPGTWTLSDGGTFTQTGNLSRSVSVNASATGEIVSPTDFCVAVATTDGTGHVWSYTESGLVNADC